MWLMELPQVSIYFKFSSEMLSRISSQMCGRWYLPIFLLRDGLFTFMYRASFMVLKRFWSSLPSMEKLSIVTSWPEMLRWSCMGNGALRCSFYLSSKFLADSPIYSSSQSTLSHLYLYMTPLLWRSGSWSLGAIRRSLMVWPPLRCTSIPYFFSNTLVTFTQSLMVRDHNVRLWSSDVTWLRVVVVAFFPFRAEDWLFNFILFMAQPGYLHFLRDWYKCFSSLGNYWAKYLQVPS